MHKYEFAAIIIGLTLICTALLRGRTPRTDGSRYYKIGPGSRE